MNASIVGRIAAKVDRARIEGVPTVVVVEIVRQTLAKLGDVIPACMVVGAVDDQLDGEITWCEVCSKPLFADEDLATASCDHESQNCEHRIAERVEATDDGDILYLCRSCASKAVPPPAPPRQVSVSSTAVVVSPCPICHGEPGGAACSTCGGSGVIAKVVG